MDLFRLNYGILTLSPKIKGAINIRQYRPICLANVIYKIITKTLTLRLNKIANNIIRPIKLFYTLQIQIHLRWSHCYIHEVFHEMARKKQSGIILKLDFWQFLEEVMIKCSKEVDTMGYEGCLW